MSWLRWFKPSASAAPSIPDALWNEVLDQYPFLGWQPDSERRRLRELSREFLRCKQFEGAQGFEVTDPIALSVAAQACLPVLNLGLKAYDGFVGIVMHEGPVRARREVVDEAGIVHEYEEELVGEAVEDGPLMLSWQQGVEPLSNHSEVAFNVVIHEFMHVLDLRDGQLDGLPPMPRPDREHWASVLTTAFDRFDELSACGYPSVIDAYGAQDVPEFFAVTVEAFFTQPMRFQAEQPELYGLYRTYFAQDPAAMAGG